MAAPATQMPSTREGVPNCPARNPVVVKMPVPIMLEITSASALTTPSCRSSAGLDVIGLDAIMSRLYLLCPRPDGQLRIPVRGASGGFHHPDIIPRRLRSEDRAIFARQEGPGIIGE